MSIYTHLLDIEKYVSGYYSKFTKLHTEFMKTLQEMNTQYQLFEDVAVEDTQFGKNIMETFQYMTKNKMQFDAKINELKLAMDENKYILLFRVSRAFLTNTSIYRAEIEERKSLIEKTNYNQLDKTKLAVLFQKHLDNLDNISPLVEKIPKIIDGDLITYYAKRLKRPIPDSGLVALFPRKKFTINQAKSIDPQIRKSDLARKVINVDVINKVDSNDDPINLKKPIIAFISDICQEQLKSVTLEQTHELHLLELQKADHHTLNMLILDRLCETIKSIIYHNPGLFRNYVTNLHIALVGSIPSGAEGVIVRGTYDNKMPFTEIYIQLSFKSDIVSSVVFPDKAFDSTSQTYATIIHELMHMMDWQLNVKPELYETTKQLLGEDPLPETLSVASLLDKLRNEALACISGELLSKMKHAFGLLISTSEITAGTFDAKLKLKELIANTHADAYDAKEFQKLTDAFKNSGDCHTLGRYMLFIIFLKKLKLDLTIIQPNQTYSALHCIRELDREWAPPFTNLNRLIQNKKWTRFDITTESAEKLFTSEMVAVLEEKNYSKFDQLIHFVSLQTPYDFFASYLDACKDLGINPEPLTPNFIFSINTSAKNHMLKMIQAMQRQFRPSIIEYLAMPLEFLGALTKK